MRRIIDPQALGSDVRYRTVDLTCGSLPIKCGSYFLGKQTPTSPLPFPDNEKLGGFILNDLPFVAWRSSNRVSSLCTFYISLSEGLLILEGATQTRAYCDFRGGRYRRRKSAEHMRKRMDD